MDRSIVETLSTQKAERKTMGDHIDTLRLDFKNHEDEIKIADSNIDLNVRAEQVLKRISKEVSEKFLGSLQTLIDEALALIFVDRDYKVEIEIIEKRGNQQIRFYLLEKMGEDMVRSYVRDDIGAGVMCVIGLIFQIYYINTVGLKRVIFVDEAFSELSDEYIESFFALLGELREKFGFVFMIITHDLRFHPYADRMYRADKGNFKEVATTKMGGKA